jgi:tape measure domain-containing protein
VADETLTRAIVEIAANQDQFDSALNDLPGQISNLEVPSINVSANTAEAVKSTQELGKHIGEVGAKAHIHVAADTEHAESGLHRIKERMDEIKEQAHSIGELIEKWIGPLAEGALVGWGVKLAMQSEAAKAGFEIVAGSAENAKRVMEELEKSKISKAFETADVNKAARELLTFGSSVGSVVPQLEMLGNLSKATQVPIDELAMSFGKAQNRGVMSFGEINQLAARGVPIYKLLADAMHVPIDAIDDLAMAGQISFATFNKALVGLTTGTGQYANATDKYLATAMGKWGILSESVKGAIKELGATLIDVFDLGDAMDSGKDIFESLKEGIKSVHEWATSAKESIKRFWDEHKVGIETGAAVVAAIAGIAAGVAAFGAITSTVIPAFIAGITALGAAFTFLTGPVGITIAAIAGVAAIIVEATGEGETFGEKMSSVWKKMEDGVEKVKFVYRNLKDEIEKTALLIVKGFLTAFPQMEAPLTSWAGTFVGVWSGLKTFFSTIIDSIKGGLTELINVFKATAAGIAAALEESDKRYVIIDGRRYQNPNRSPAGITGAFSDAFNNTLAGQQNAPNKDAFAEFIKAQKEGADAFRKSIANKGGLTKAIDSELAEIDKRIADTERKHNEKPPEPWDTSAWIPKKKPPGGSPDETRRPHEEISFSSLTEAWKKVQEDISKNDAAHAVLGVAQQHLKVGQDAAAIAKQHLEEARAANQKAAEQKQLLQKLSEQGWLRPNSGPAILG